MTDQITGKVAMQTISSIALPKLPGGSVPLGLANYHARLKISRMCLRDSFTYGLLKDPKDAYHKGIMYYVLRPFHWFTPWKTMRFPGKVRFPYGFETTLLGNEFSLG